MHQFRKLSRARGPYTYSSVCANYSNWSSWLESLVAVIALDRNNPKRSSVEGNDN